MMTNTTIKKTVVPIPVVSIVSGPVLRNECKPYAEGVTENVVDLASHPENTGSNGAQIADLAKSLVDGVPVPDGKVAIVLEPH